MSKKITVEITFTEAEFRKMVKEAECEIVDEAQFLKVLYSKKFAKELAGDLKSAWTQANEDSYELEEILGCLGFDECIEEKVY